jgi:GDP-L-fucose synthase
MSETDFVVDKSLPVLITGGTGLVGKALNTHLSTIGYENVFAVGSKDCNLLDTAAVDALFDKIKPAYVFHLAARVHGLGGNAKYKSDVLVENTLMNVNVIESARKIGARKVVAMGSGCVYPDLKNLEALNETLVWQGAPHPSEDSYGHAKRLMLAHLDAASKQYGLRSAFVISGNLYGPHDSFNIEDGHVIPSLVSKFHKAKMDGNKVSVWGTGAAIRDFTYSSDMAKALELILQNIEGPVNAGSGFRHRIRDIVDELTSITGVEVAWDSTKSDGQLVRYYELDRLEACGFEPEVSLVDGIRKTYEWYEATYPNVRK